MKRKASSAFDEEDDDVGERRLEPRRAPPSLDDYLLAEEILPRLPVRFAAACAVGALRGVLTDLDYWLLRNRRLPRPRAACLVVGKRSEGDDRLRHVFHYADAALSAEPAIVRGAGGSVAAYRLAGTCNGLVLLTAPWSKSNHRCVRGLLFNPASGDEGTFVVDLPCNGGAGDLFCCFCGFGYSPSNKTYKAFVLARDRDSSGELMVVGGRQGLRTVAFVHYNFHSYPSSLTMDGKVYILVDYSASTVLIFDVADETVTATAPIAHGPPHEVRTSSELIEVWGRPCVAMRHGEGYATALWSLTAEHRWERRCTLVFFASPGSRILHGAWDCGDGQLFALYRDGRGCMLDLGREVGSGAHRPVSAKPRPPEDEEAKASLAELEKGTFCWGYRPTLLRLASVFGDGACSDEGAAGLRHSSFRGQRRRGRSRRCLEALLEMMMRRPPERG